MLWFCFPNPSGPPMKDAEVFAVTSLFTCPFYMNTCRVLTQYLDSPWDLLPLGFSTLKGRPNLRKVPISNSLQYPVWLQSPPLENTASTVTGQISEGLLSYVSSHIKFLNIVFHMLFNQWQELRSFSLEAQQLIELVGLQACTVGSSSLRALHSVPACARVPLPLAP